MPWLTYLEGQTTWCRFGPSPTEDDQAGMHCLVQLKGSMKIHTELASGWGTPCSSWARYLKSNVDTPGSIFSSLLSTQASYG